MERQEKLQITILILIAIFIVVLIATLVILVKNVDEIKSDPVQYAVDNGLYDSCSCINENIGQRHFGNKLVIQNWTG